MNKKFSTLVASLLFASAFSAYAGTAASTLAVPTAIETRATATVLDINTEAPVADDAVKDLVLSGFKDNSRLLVFSSTGANTWTPASASSFLMFDGNGIHLADYMGGSVSSVPSNAFYFNYTNKQLETKAGLVLNLAGYSKFDIVPVTFKGKSSSFFVLRAWYDATTPVYINMAGGFSTGTNITVVDDVTKAALFASAETAFATTSTTGDVLNEELKDGFELAISSAKDGVVVKGAEAFVGKLTAMSWSAGKFVPATQGASSYYLKNKDGKFIYWNADANKDSDKPGAFALMSETDANTKFTGNIGLFEIFAADNGSDLVKVIVETDKRLYINNTNNEGRLTAFAANDPDVNAANWAVTSLGSSNTVDLTQFLTGQFVKVNYVANGEEGASNTYKIDGVLTISEDGTKEDFAKAKSFVAEDPATHRAVTTEDRGTTIKLTNRENPSVEVTLSELRGTNKTGVYEVAATTATNLKAEELITITPVTTVTMTDGYMVENENVLRNTSYYLAQSRQNADQDIPAYWAENHSMSHQIGATVNKDAATKWNLAFKVKGGDKAYKNQIDSVLIVSTLHKWNAAAKDVEEVKSTLAILPYTFQNRENNEFVKNYKYTNLEYYICDKDNNEAADNGAAQKFALKKKPGNTYNYVTLVNNGAAVDGVATGNKYNDNGYIQLTSNKSDFALGEDKLFLGNSLENGSWEEMAMYAKDNNSLMLVQPSDDPEYHLVNGDVLAWGDTIKLYRDENANQALYEKGDSKSIVENDTLSFLNIDNVYDPQFKLNPAIFVDTAYVNRENNTCWQYLLAVNVDNSVKTYCPDDPKHNDPEWIKEHGVCPHAEKTPVVKGRFLVNLIDTANIYGATHLHTNPYVNTNEAGEQRAKLSFVPGMHIKDTLFLFTNDDTVKVELGTPDFNVAKFAFRYEDAAEGTFKIQNMWKAYNPEQAVKDDSKVASNNEGYLKWINGTVVVEDGYNKGDLFRIEEGFEGNPTANEEAPEVSSISVVATNGAVVIKGAEGKTVAISNVLGQTVANTVITSSEATIAVPAGIVVVAVEGEAAVKAIVK